MYCLHAAYVLYIILFIQNDEHVNLHMGFVLENLIGDPSILKNQSLISLRISWSKDKNKEMLIKLEW